MRLEAAAGEDAAAQTDGGDFGTTELEATISARRAMYYLDADQRGAAPESVLFVGQSKERLLRARGYAMRALMLCPLHDLARYSLLETGFLAGESKETSESLIRQWAKLRSRNADVSQIIARIAVIHPRGEVARQMVRQVTDLAPGREVLFWPMIQLLGGEQSLEEVLPDNAESILQAIEALRLEGEIRQRLLTRADGLIQVGLKGQENTLKGADFAALASRLALARQNRAEAEAWLFKAIIWAPRNAQHRYRFVTLLEENGEFEKARQQLEICLKWEPENRVFIARRESLLEKLEATKKQR
jgi:tetratricopeptide (TPR) repeat protein